MFPGAPGHRQAASQPARQPARRPATQQAGQPASPSVRVARAETRLTVDRLASFGTAAELVELRPDHRKSVKKDI